MLFTSDLYRTRQTLSEIQGQWRKDLIRTDYIPKIPVILPCASEVAGVGKNGDCDSSVSITQKMARENYPKCKIGTLNTWGKDDCYGNWSVYLDFYGQKMRGQTDTITGSLFKSRKSIPRMHCRDTTLLAMAVYCLDFSNLLGSSRQANPMKLAQFMNPISGGTKKRKRRIKKN